MKLWRHSIKLTIRVGFMGSGKTAVGKMLSEKTGLKFVDIDILIEKADSYSLPIVILGYAFKPETNIITGSHALLVKSIVNIKGYPVVLVDEHILPSVNHPEKAVYLIGCKHPEYRNYTFPAGSVVIDPFRYIPDQDDVKVMRLGEQC